MKYKSFGLALAASILSINAPSNAETKHNQGEYTRQVDSAYEYELYQTRELRQRIRTDIKSLPQQNLEDKIKTYGRIISDALDAGLDAMASRYSRTLTRQLPQAKIICPPEMRHYTHQEAEVALTKLEEEKSKRTIERYASFLGQALKDGSCLKAELGLYNLLLSLHQKGLLKESFGEVINLARENLSALMSLAESK